MASSVARRVMSKTGSASVAPAAETAVGSGAAADAAAETAAGSLAAAETAGI
jgi:hypothetical protein